MKTKLFIIALTGILFTSCQKEMKVSRSNHSVTTELHDMSPIYISKDNNGEVNLNQANRIGNTHWILSVERDLTLGDISQALQEITYRKYQKESAHEDNMDIYFVYSDTLNKQNAFVKMPFEEIQVAAPEIHPELTVKYLQDVVSLEDFKLKFEQTYAIQEPFEYVNIYFSKEMIVEDFVNVLIEIDKLNINDKVSKSIHIH